LEQLQSPVKTAGAVPLSLLDDSACAGVTVVTLADMSTSGTLVGVSTFIGPNDEVIDWIEATGFLMAGELGLCTL
jgi:hypothetical protein